MTYRATTSPARSSNSLVCKFSYVPPDATTPPSAGWDPAFLTHIGLGDVVEGGMRQLGGTTGERLADDDDEREALVMTVRSELSCPSGRVDVEG